MAHFPTFFGKWAFFIFKNSLSIKKLFVILQPEMYSFD